MAGRGRDIFLIAARRGVVGHGPVGCGEAWRGKVRQGRDTLFRYGAAWSGWAWRGEARQGF